MKFIRNYVKWKCINVYQLKNLTIKIIFINQSNCSLLHLLTTKKWSLKIFIGSHRTFCFCRCSMASTRICSAWTRFTTYITAVAPKTRTKQLIERQGCGAKQEDLYSATHTICIWWWNFALNSIVHSTLGSRSLERSLRNRHLYCYMNQQMLCRSS